MTAFLDTYACLCVAVFSCGQLWDLMNYSPPGSSVHGILQARIWEWVAMPSSKGSSRPKDWTHISCLLYWELGSLPLTPPGKSFPPQTREQFPIYNWLNLIKTYFSRIRLRKTSDKEEQQVFCCFLLCWVFIAAGRLSSCSRQTLQHVGS